jgi:hypothetical protein
MDNFMRNGIQSQCDHRTERSRCGVGQSKRLTERDPPHLRCLWVPLTDMLAEASFHSH